jgi:hypothetical protein
MAKKSAPKKAAPAKQPAKKAPAKAAAKPAAAPRPARPADAADLKDLRKSVEREVKTCRKNEITLGRRIDEIGSAGERILGEVEALRKDFASSAAAVEKAAKAEKALAELKAAVEALRKESAAHAKDPGLCNAGPLADSFKGVDRKVAGFAGDMEALNRTFRGFAASLAAKVDELAAKFNLHSHFLQAKNWNQDLLFHMEPSVGTDKASPLPDANKPLMTKPARSTKEPPAFAIELRLTPPRHWDDPVIWFDNVGPIEKEESKG